MTLKIVSAIILMLILTACRKTNTLTSTPKPWDKTFGGSSEDQMTRVLPTPDGAYIMTGYTSSSNADVTGNKGSLDMWVVKLKSNREIEWQKNFGSAGMEYANYIALAPDGGYIVAGSTNTASVNGDVMVASKGEFDVWVLKLDKLESITWQKTLGGSRQEMATDVIVLANGDCVVLADTRSWDGDIVRDPNITMADSDIWILKLDGTNGIY